MLLFNDVLVNQLANYLCAFENSVRLSFAVLEESALNNYLAALLQPLLELLRNSHHVVRRIRVQPSASLILERVKNSLQCAAYLPGINRALVYDLLQLARGSIAIELG